METTLKPIEIISLKQQCCQFRGINKETEEGSAKNTVGHVQVVINLPKNVKSGMFNNTAVLPSWQFLIQKISYKMMTYTPNDVLTT